MQDSEKLLCYHLLVRFLLSPSPSGRPGLPRELVREIFELAYLTVHAPEYTLKCTSPPPNAIARSRLFPHLFWFATPPFTREDAKRIAHFRCSTLVHCLKPRNAKRCRELGWFASMQHIHFALLARPRFPDMTDDIVGYASPWMTKQSTMPSKFLGLELRHSKSRTPPPLPPRVQLVHEYANITPRPDDGYPILHCPSHVIQGITRRKSPEIVDGPLNIFVPQFVEEGGSIGVFIEGKPKETPWMELQGMLTFERYFEVDRAIGTLRRLPRNAID